jgi:hypothetical protein
MWEGAPRWCRRRFDGRSCAGIVTATSPGVTDHMRGVTPIMWSIGHGEVEPGSRTSCCCVVDITAWSTREVGSPSSSRETDRCSDDPTDRCSRIALHRPRRPGLGGSQNVEPHIHRSFGELPVVCDEARQVGSQGPRCRKVDRVERAERCWLEPRGADHDGVVHRD